MNKSRGKRDLPLLRVEVERENKLSVVSDPLVRKRIEKIFGMERARAHARIQTMAK